MPFGIGHWELLILAGVILLIFGSSKVPRIARELGQGLREVRKTMADVDPRTPLRELESPPEEDDEAAASRPASESRR
jgi:sec-independent protein translocase protein TatA